MDALLKEDQWGNQAWMYEYTWHGTRFSQEMAQNTKLFYTHDQTPPPPPGAPPMWPNKEWSGGWACQACSTVLDFAFKIHFANNAREETHCANCGTARPINHFGCRYSQESVVE